MGKTNFVEGVLDVALKGFGFVKTSVDEQDIFIAKEKLGGAIHGDLVRVKEKKVDWTDSIAKTFGVGRRREGEIVEVVERRVKNIVGILMKSNTGYFIIPDEERLGQSFDISGFDDKLIECSIDGECSLVGQKVVVRLDDCGNTRIDEVIGRPGDVGNDILSIIRAHNLYEEFSKEVEDEANVVAKPVSEKSIEKRLDLRKKMIITIDPHDAKDLDDAVHIEKREDGTWELGVHIADVCHYVKEGSFLDKEAYERGTSVYFPDRVLPMLPRVLSNGVCSLHPNVDRLALSVIMNIDPNGDVLSHKIVESVINVKYKFSYDEVQQLLDGTHHSLLTAQLKKKYLPLFKNMAVLTKVIEGQRRARGEVSFNVPEPRIILDTETGRIKDVVAYPRYLSHRIIETFMILCNEVVAKKMNDLDMPFVYRVHEKPDPKKVADFVETLKPFAVQHKINPSSISGRVYQEMLDSINKDVDDALEQIISKLALRSMSKAKYLEKNLGHFGLGAKHYCHFTSPIRRYPDLVIHRIIKMMLNRKLSSHKMEEMRDFVVDASIQSSKREVLSTEAEREVDNLKRAEFMKDKIGEQFIGTISGIRDFGVFVYLDNTVEGLVRIENMPKDNYTFNEKQMTYVGKKRTYKMGDKLDVIVSSVSLERRQVEFGAV
ncbi:MAG: ribonuclease R [Firmicutes bacterium]|nr:ribonuclease R [Bacillota bacterium]